MAFKHRDFLKKLAKRSEISDTPWDDFQEKKLGGDWTDLEAFPVIEASSEYRRKPASFNVNGFEFDEPVDYALPDGTNYYLPNLTKDTFIEDWKQGQFPSLDNINLSNGLVHLSKISAANHAKAMLSLTKKAPKPVIIPDGTPSPTEA